MKREMIGKVENKRALERFDLHIPARIVRRGTSGEEEPLEAVTRDISASGAYLRIEQSELGVGTHVQLEMVLSLQRLKELLEGSDSVTAVVEGKVIREDEDGAVVVFEKPIRFSPVRA